MNKSPEMDKLIWNIRSNKGNYENPVCKPMTNVRLGRLLFLSNEWCLYRPFYTFGSED